MTAQPPVSVQKVQIEALRRINFWGFVKETEGFDLAVY
jgi:hypothetical protein